MHVMRSIVLLLGLLASTEHCAQATELAALAQSIADVACPYAMLQSYGCPIQKSKSVSDCFKEMGGMCELMPQSRFGNSTHWSIGSVPLGVGFDSINMTVRLPFFFPVGEAKHVYDINITDELYTSIESYAGSINPSELRVLMTGTLNTDMKNVHSTYFGSYSMLHRTTQTDIVMKAQLTSDPELLPRVKEALDNYLPEAYDETVYAEFIHYWGTHVVTAAAIGGACEHLVSVKACYASGNAVFLDQEAQLQMAIETMQATGRKLSNDYIKYTTHCSVTTYGGDPTQDPALWKPDNWKERQQTIAEAPVLITVDAMRPIADFIDNPSIKANFQKAVANLQKEAIAKRNASIREAKSDQVHSITGATTVSFDNFGMAFGHSIHTCHRCYWIATCCHCSGTTGSFRPNCCGDGCGGTFTGSIIVNHFPTTTLKAGQSATMSPDGSKTCLCPSGSYSMPEFPFRTLEQSFVCSINSNGQVKASSVKNPDRGNQLVSHGTEIHIDGEWVTQGCSVANVTYTSSTWSISWNGRCGSSGTVSPSGSFTANGWCCIGSTLVAEGNGCAAKIDVGSCPGFNP